VHGRHHAGETVRTLAGGANQSCERLHALAGDAAQPYADNATWRVSRDSDMTNYFKLPTWADSDHVYAVVETPRGSRAKLEFDPKLGAFTLAKPLLAGLTYPYDWGFIPSTKAEDGDPLDVLIIHDAATYPGLVLKCKPIGVLEVVQSSKDGNERNDRVFVVPDRSPFEGDLQDIRRLPARAIEELEKFFEATNALESKKLKFQGWRGPAKAIKTIKKVAV
jgi:inorganic pyrophosphatase